MSDQNVDPVENEVETEVEQPEVAKTADGVVINDPARAQRKLAEWETLELMAFLKGELEGLPNQLTAGIVKEYGRREELEAAWSDQEVLDFFRNGVEPARTANGVWVNDVTRVNRSAQDWATLELEAWAAGEITPKGKANAQKLTAELVRRFDLSGPASDTEAVLKQYRHKTQPAQEPSNGDTGEANEPEPSVEEEPAPKVENKPAPVVEGVGALTAMNVGFIDTTMERYIEAVSPRKQITDEEGGAAQRSLDGLFAYVMRLEGKALGEGLDRIKKIIDANRDGVFSPSNAHRFIHRLKGNARHQAQHVNLIELFLIVTDKNPARKQQVDIRHMVSGLHGTLPDVMTDYFKNHA